MKRLLLLLLLFHLTAGAHEHEHEIDIDITNQQDINNIFYIVYTKPNGDFGQKLFHIDKHSRKVFHMVEILPKTLEPPAKHWYVYYQKPTKVVDCNNHFIYQPEKPVMTVRLLTDGRCEIQ